jgi:hypothetical protein
MKSKSFRAVTKGLALLLVFHTLASGQELKPIPLPKPQTEGGKPLMQALKERQSARAFSTNSLPLQGVGRQPARFGPAHRAVGQQPAGSGRLRRHQRRTFPL